MEPLLPLRDGESNFAGRPSSLEGARDVCSKRLKASADPLESIDRSSSRGGGYEEEEREFACGFCGRKLANAGPRAPHNVLNIFNFAENPRVPVPTQIAAHTHMWC